MKSSKQVIREQLEAGMAVFLSQGKTVTKVESLKSAKNKRSKEPKEKTVEIEVNFLPLALQSKYFGE